MNFKLTHYRQPGHLPLFSPFGRPTTSVLRVSVGSPFRQDVATHLCQVT
ncbi:MAG: hypothetical protein NTZ98_06260 [Acidobacteria bacterium]|jgi:hypothetical protein|nr:hypothetical protein [Acidobacteriota bacterium]